jgi:hypothetical protein
MKFFISNDIRNNSLLKLIVVFTLVFLFFLWLTNLLLYIKSYLGLLEESHFHFFSMAIILVTLNHLILFSKIKNVWKLIIILASYMSAFGDIAAGWLIRYISPSFAYLKLGSVLVLQISFAALLVLVLAFLYSGKDNNLRQFKA